MDAALRRDAVTMLEGLQGNVVTAYGSSEASYVFARVRKPVRARAWLDRERLRVTTHRGWEREPSPTTLNLAFGYDGLVSLGVPEPRIERLQAFREGMGTRSKPLGDVGASSRGRWQTELREEQHVLLVLTARDGASLRSAEREALSRLEERKALEAIYVQRASRLEGMAEHFGFSDGFSQPSIEGVPGSAPRRGEGTLTKWGVWRRLALGEFVLGYRDEGGLFAPAPLGPLGDDATFLVIRKLRQDVALFRRHTEQAAREIGREPEWLRAKMVGRWPNGSALARHPNAPGPPASRDRMTSRFSYEEDPDGLRCPRGAHVRRANPRDSLGWQGRLTQRHRIIRRGMPYGSVLPAGSAQDDGRERGLVFVCYQSNIERQFEFIQQRWLSDGNSLRLGDDRDPLVACKAGRFVIPGSAPQFLAGIPSFVQTRGGGYYLLPGAAGLGALAAGCC